MPHTPVPAAELASRLARLRLSMDQFDPSWAMMILDHKIDLYYFTGTMPDGVLVITPDDAVLFVRRSAEPAQQESCFPDIRAMRSFRTIAEAFPCIPETVYVAARTMTLQKLTLLQKHLPFTPKPADSVLSALRAVKSAYELDCMRTAGRLHQRMIEQLAPNLLREGISEARYCSEICTAMIDAGGMGISRFNQPVAEDVLGVASFSENSLLPAMDSPSGTAGTCIAMKSIGSSQRRLHRGDTVLLDIPCGFRGYHTDKSIVFYYGSLAQHPQGDLIRAAHEQCIALEQEAASLLRPGAMPAEIYETILSHVDPIFRDSFMNGCKFIGHSIGLVMDETPVLARGFDAPLATGMTLAVEPKIALEGIGLIGCENTYEIVPQGAARSLSGACNTPLEING
ncbi:M24 family metallopeptidase [Agathobaculum desmolans]|uniref:M24 family metallopeptidase n=1 Tax=Agathobaculum desmolans TaxID=39484 RepID=UPI000553DE2B|nr:M24 family metallopeptidase [Agathobaculum desmolans]